MFQNPIFLTPGKHLHVHSHIPPQPTKSDCLLKFQAARERESIDAVQRCLLHPPLSGTFTSGVTELEIVNDQRVTRAVNGNVVHALDA